MLSTPTPARPMRRRLGADSSSLASAWTAERTMSASASASSAARPILIWSCVTMFQPGSCLKTASVAGETFSAITIFMDFLLLGYGVRERLPPHPSSIAQSIQIQQVFSSYFDEDRRTYPAKSSNQWS